MKRYSANQAYLEEHLHRMHHDIEIVTRKLELEKRRLSKLDEEARRARQEYDDKVMPSRRSGGSSKEAAVPVSARGRNSVVTAPMRALESRLESNLRKLDGANNESFQLREAIDQIRKERLQMNAVFKRLQEEIKGNSRTISGLCQEADAARDITEDAGRRIAAMKKKLDGERNVFKTDVLRLHEEMKHQDREKKEWEVRLYKEQYGRGSKNDFLVADEEGEFSEDSLMKRILKLAFLNCIQRRHIKQHQKNIEVFEQAFATIKSTTGISDIEEIVKIFVKLEERNFSLLTYVNQLNREIESFEKQDRDLRLKQQRLKVEEEKTNQRRKVALSETEQQLHQTQTQIEENDSSYQVLKEMFDTVKPIIFGVAHRLEKETKGAAVAPTETADEHILHWLLYVERTLAQWREFLPEARSAREPGFKPFAYTVGSTVKQLPPKKSHGGPGPLLKTSDLPVAMLEEKRQGATGAQGRGGDANEDESDEEDYGERPWTMAELKEKSLSSLAKRRRVKGLRPAGQVGDREDKSAKDAGGAGAKEADTKESEKEIDYNQMVAEKKEEEEEQSDDSDGDQDEGGEPTDDELNEIFLKRYKMSKEELQAMADKMGIQLNNLCYLKQEFDAYDEDRSGYIDVKELRELLHKLGEELTEEELEQAFKELDADGSGEIEFFEFVEWFTSED